MRTLFIAVLSLFLPHFPASSMSAPVVDTLTTAAPNCRSGSCGYQSLFKKVARFKETESRVPVADVWETLNNHQQSTFNNVVTVSLDYGGGESVDQGGGIIVGDRCDTVLTSAHVAFDHNTGKPLDDILVKSYESGLINAIHTATVLDTSLTPGTRKPEGISLIAKDWAMIKLNRPILSSSHCNPTPILTDINSKKQSTSTPDQLKNTYLHINIVEGSEFNKMHENHFALELNNCSRFDIQSPGLPTNDMGVVPHNCTTVKGSSGFPIFEVQRDGSLLLIGIHNGDYQRLNSSKEKTTSSPLQYRPLDFSGRNGAINFATAFKDPRLLQYLQRLYQDNPYLIKTPNH